MRSHNLLRHCRTALTTTVVASVFAAPAFASSHREAPFLTGMPKVDATDFYMFRSYPADRAAYTTIIANYVPLQDAYGGPNYFAMDPKALYEIHIDQNGDGVEDLTFQFRFSYENRNTTLPINGKNVAIPLVINGASDINTVNSPAANVRETYTVSVVRGERRKNKPQPVMNGSSTVFDKPLDNIGNKSIKDYAAYAAKHVFDAAIPGCASPAKIFVGQRKDPFVVNLGETFDLVNIAAPAVELSANAESAEKNSLADKNVTSIAMEVPTACLTNGAEPIIGGWTTASVRQGRLINPKPNGDPKDLSASKEGGPWVQVSRLGMPLVNELVIGLKDKNLFNASKPIDDAANFADYVFTPTLPALLEKLFAAQGVKAPTNFPRTDLIATFLTGIDGFTGRKTFKPAEMLRLNTSIDPNRTNPNRLGALGGDTAGFPNGRRLGDDVVDITLRVAMGKLCKNSSGLNTIVGCKDSDAATGDLQFTDGAYIDHSATYADNVFPYAKTPIAGSPSN